MQDGHDGTTEEFGDTSAANVGTSHSVKNADGSLQQGNSVKYNNKTQGLFVWTAPHLIRATKTLKGQWWVANSEHHSNTRPDQHSKTGNIEPIEINFSHSNAPDKDSDLYPHIAATRIITDTRKIEAGDIFLAVIGENFDGHDFLAMAMDKGAVAAIVSRINHDCTIPQLLVEDTRLAFGHIAAYRRQQHQALKVIAITGSSGKTTVKEMLRSIFLQADNIPNASQSSSQLPPSLQTQTSIQPSSQANSQTLPKGHTTLITRGNLNNDYGVPMMLLELADYHKYAVLELGANHVGEIAYTANIAKPDVACILNIGTAHLGEFGGRDNIAKTKAEIYQALNTDGIAIVPYDDEYANTLREVAQKQTSNIISFGWQFDQLAAEEGKSDNLPDIYATEVVSTATENSFTLHIAKNDTQIDPIALKVTLPMPGRHNVSNALAAASCAYAIGISTDSIVKGLTQAQSTKGRLGRLSLGRHTIIDDTYNANPNAVRAAADVLAVQTGEKILVLGDIGELGDSAQDEHEKLGRSIAAKSIDRLLCVGDYAPNTIKGANSYAAAKNLQQAEAFATKAELLSTLEALILDSNRKNKTCTLLFKGSRSATMETVIESLIARFANE